MAKKIKDIMTGYRTKKHGKKRDEREPLPEQDSKTAHEYRKEGSELRKK